MSMEFKHIIILSAIICLTIIQLVCLLKDVNHAVLMAITALIVQLANLVWGKVKKRRET